MEKAEVKVGKIIIPTYPEPAAEELPMFAENRVHQRTSGRPYPNKVVMQVDRSHREDREYTVVTLENKYVKIEILPEIGGRIYSALDKTTGYDYFYKQHVIKPALIGVLGSWISGGVEFNWPFHHRASGFMPCDFTVEQLEDGTAVCHLSEHDPIDRMKGMVSIILRPDESSFETKMSLYNRTAVEKSFLWWENAAVPVNEDYQIFFPQDVSYVNFHYLKSRTTYPIAGNGVFNGIPMDEDRDISWHKNTRQATSYFACKSEYDFFGGYDHGKECGVVHIADHHISPGKKMFTWAYCQLSKAWERALTDTDGEYAELMAGSYSDNQPNFSWLAPYETKEFSQHWYPISKIGTPTFANLNMALKIDRDKGCINLQTTREYKSAKIEVVTRSEVFVKEEADITPKTIITVNPDVDLSEKTTVRVIADGKCIGEYQEKSFDNLNMPEVISDMPSAADMNSADELYLAGVHVDLYRDPHTNPDSYWKEALKRNVNHIPSLIAMAKYELGRYCIKSALEYMTRAEAAQNMFNERPQSGELYYTFARILEAHGNCDKAYDYYYKAFWSADCAAKAMTRIALIDIKRCDYDKAVEHAEKALDYGRKNNLACACLILALKELGNNERAEKLAAEQLERDSMDYLTRFIIGDGTIYKQMDSDAVQICLDIAFDLDAAGRDRDIVKLLSELESEREDCHRKPLYYTLGYYKNLIGEDGKAEYKKAEQAQLGACYPHRFEEIAVYDGAVSDGCKEARMLLGCIFYNKRQYKIAAQLWSQCSDYISRRNLAVAYFSHLNKPDKALEIMESLVAERPQDEELRYETVVLMDKMGVAAADKIEMLGGTAIRRDDVFTELAKAYNQAFMPDKALETLLSHQFVPCEGGEHAIADQYMFAYLVKGKIAFESGDTDGAIEFFRAGQHLPDCLGAGIWNHCKLIPLKYHEALCLEKKGKKAQADEIFKYIANVEIEYFSNMHLKELPYYQAKAFEHLNEKVKAQHKMTAYLREWSKIKDIKDNGFFGTTPFFISFVDDPSRLRCAQYEYLMALCSDFAGNTSQAREYIYKSAKKNNENLFALFFEKFGFLK